jgi:hypothetical protein
VLGYSLIDLELVAVAGETGLLDIVLDRILASSCEIQFPLPSLQAGAQFDLALRYQGQTFSTALDPHRL